MMSSKSGRKIAARGLNVRVLPIPDDKANDPDEYFKIRKNEYNDFLTSNVQDFVPWLAARLMSGKTTQTEMSAVIVDIAEVLARYGNQNAVNMYIEKFTSLYKYGSIWKAEYQKAKNALHRAALKDKGYRCR